MNLLELNPLAGKPAVIVARSYVAAFDRYLNKQLQDLGVEGHFVDDRSFAREDGDVHCAINEVRLCRTVHAVSR